MTDLLPRSEGSALDVEVAERVMGWTLDGEIAGIPQVVAHFGSDCPKGPPPSTSRSTVHCPQFSSDIASAFLVVEAMRAKGAEIRITQEPHNAEWEVTIWLREKIDGEWWFSSRDPLGKGLEESLPLAICRAALAALDASTPTSERESPSPSASVEPLRQNT